MQFYVKNDLGETPFKIKVPILSKEYYLLDNEREDLLKHIIFNSGQYVAVPKVPVPKPTPKENTKYKDNTTNTGNKPTKNKRKDDPFDDDLQPAF